MKIFDYGDLGKKRSWDYSMNGITPEDDGIRPIIETDKEINIGDVLIIDNVAYHICCISGKGSKYNIAYVERLRNQRVFVDREEPEEECYTDQITCPYCGYENSDSWEADDDEYEYECPCCMSTFSYQRNVTVEYCSQPVKKAEAVILT